MDFSKLIQFIAVIIIIASVVGGGVIIYNIVKVPGTPENNVAPSVRENLPVQNQNQQEIKQQVLEQDPQNTKQSTGPAVDIAKVKTIGRPYIGEKNAPVVIAYWFDYQCPFCKKMEANIIPQLIIDYIEPGKVKLVYKDYQFLGVDSQTAGLAARAVWEIAPERFFEWHKAMYGNQDGENYAWGSKGDILILTKSLGIDSVKVGKLMTDKAGEYQSAINADKAEGKMFGIKGTPGTIIGKKLIVGTQSYDKFKSAIEQAILEY